MHFKNLYSRLVKVRYRKYFSKKFINRKKATAEEISWFCAAKQKTRKRFADTVENFFSSAFAKLALWVKISSKPLIR